MKFYYWLWIDFISAAQNHDNSETEARFYALVFLSMALCFNIFVLIGALEFFFDVQLHWDIQKFNSKKINSLASFLVNFYLLPLILNYFLAVRTNRWKRIKAKYEYDVFGKIHLGKGRYSFKYILLSIVVWLIFVIYFGLLKHD